METGASSRPEYQHYIPQFILRNFAHEYEGKTISKLKLCKNKPALNTVNLDQDTPVIQETSTRRTFGLMNMYTDICDARDRNHIEKKLSKLECSASTIIRRITKALESGENGVRMQRSDRDLLRKFLFIMKYRGPGFHRRFQGNENGTYVADDKKTFDKYMEEKGYKRPVDVWLKAIDVIIDLNMDNDGEWQAKLLSDIYPPDATWFIAHVEHYFLAFCTPRKNEDEFILTENAYAVHEGPNTTTFNQTTEEMETEQWFSYHEFGPISPKLTLVLRHAILPNKLEDTNEKVKIKRQELHKWVSKHHLDPEEAMKSTLLDLPITKPLSSNIFIVDNCLSYRDGHDGRRRKNDLFTFPFFRISRDQVRTINRILLENAQFTSQLVFNSTESLKATLKDYLEYPLGEGYKTLEIGSYDARVVYFKKLECVARRLDPEIKAVYMQVHPESMEAPSVEVIWNRIQEDFFGQKMVLVYRMLGRYYLKLCEL